MKQLFGFLMLAFKVLKFHSGKVNKIS